MMKYIRRLLTSKNGRSLRKDKRGASALEYALLSGIVAVSLIAGGTIFANDLGSKFATMGAAVVGSTADAVVTTGTGHY